MTPTQIARRSDALYADGTCGMTRRVLCDMVAQRESDLEDARAENAKLRERIDAAHMSRLLTENENESLRELVRELYEDQCIDGDRWKYRDRIHELGIEVEQ